MRVTPSGSELRNRVRRNVPYLAEAEERVTPVLQRAASSSEAQRLRASFREMLCALGACCLGLLHALEQALKLPSEGALSTRLLALAYCSYDACKSALEKRESRAVGAEAAAIGVVKGAATAVSKVAHVASEKARSYDGPGAEYVAGAVKAVDDLGDSLESARVQQEQQRQSAPESGEQIQPQSQQPERESHPQPTAVSAESAVPVQPLATDAPDVQLAARPSVSE